ncbi:hypothetical protein PHSY_007335 [Pseudozyma hubeiensis SY62]|uniref:Uncharacterized protein n=1 Tax=Pseudozyma hubeiensis (strain SY62) TaxID=1305764 RepID=R9PEP2_PSEHS|nr:hypothetical protein PHSY_007335 [Pseudozyma hubeiensis SY62]GAC99732.1 hypothetical protein PHSY_007335 [Pseudozyma hubeiensis SY62]
MTDLTLSTDSFTQYNAVDIISPYMCSLARDNYLRHVMPVAGRKNASVDDKITGEANVGKVAARYDLDPYSLAVEQRRSEKVRGEVARLAKELPETILELGAFHPLFSLGLDARKNKYLAQCLLLLEASPEADGENTMEMLVTAGTAEIFHDQIKLFVRNLHDLHQQDAKSGVKVSLVECIDWHHVFAYMNLPGKVKAQVDDVAKMFMLA